MVLIWVCRHRTTLQQFYVSINIIKCKVQSADVLTAWSFSEKHNWMDWTWTVNRNPEGCCEASRSCLLETLTLRCQLLAGATSSLRPQAVSTNISKNCFYPLSNKRTNVYKSTVQRFRQLWSTNAWHPSRSSIREPSDLFSHLFSTTPNMQPASLRAVFTRNRKSCRWWCTSPDHSLCGITWGGEPWSEPGWTDAVLPPNIDLTSLLFN